jgi:pimeloyl-ACP methyl ester carboxylesterase
MGDPDRVIPTEEGRKIARRIPGAQIVTITGTGHLSYLERLEIFNDLVLRFLDCSEAASFVTSIALTADGGYVAQ